MNILRTDIDAVNAVLTVEVKEADYSENYQKTLKKYRQKANVPGFRVGMAPMAMIKRMYGGGVKADEINKLIQNAVYQYISDNKIDVLGEPLPNQEDEARAIDFDKDVDFEFKYDIAIAPEFEVTLNKRDSLKVYAIDVTDEMVDNQVKNYADRFGKHNDVEAALDSKDMLKGDLCQLDADGKVLEGGIRVENAVMASHYMAADDQKALFADAKVNNVIVFSPRKAFANDADLASMLNISKEEAANVTSDFQFEVKAITHFTSAELDKELFDQVFPQAGVETVEDFRNKVAEGIKTSYTDDSDYRFLLDAKALVLKKMADVVLPEAALKRWLKLTHEKMTDEQIEDQYPEMAEDLKWQLFSNKIAKANDIKIDKEDIEAYARKMTRIQFAQYGMTDIPEDILDNYSKNMLNKLETVERISNRSLEEKVVAVIRNTVKTVDTTISLEDFGKLFENK